MSTDDDDSRSQPELHIIDSTDGEANDEGSIHLHQLDPLDVNGRIQCLQDVAQHIANLSTFDKDDVAAVEFEIERLEQDVVAHLRQLAQARLEFLKRLDDALDLATNHPRLNNFFLSKQQDMMEAIQTRETMEKKQQRRKHRKADA